MRNRIIFCFFSIILFPTLTHAAAADYLILQDIGTYKLFTGIQGRVFSGPPSKFTQTATGGVLDAADHFSQGDMSYDASYTEPGGKWPFVKVEVTQHSGADSDKWLLHELERGFRDTDNLEESPAEDTMLRTINNNKIFFYGGGVVGYRWISNNVLVNIQYTNLSGPKPEPLEIVQAYLQKFPSTIPTSLVLDKTHDVQWIKDEMDRRLWLCDKWFYQLQLGKVQQSDAFQAAVKSMNVFLDYRQKYYGINATDDKNLLASYLSTNNGTGIKTKLSEYETWWAANKGNAITLP